MNRDIFNINIRNISNLNLKLDNIYIPSDSTHSLVSSYIHNINYLAGTNFRGTFIFYQLNFDENRQYSIKQVPITLSDKIIVIDKTIFIKRSYASEKEIKDLILDVFRVITNNFNGDMAYYLIKYTDSIKYGVDNGYTRNSLVYNKVFSDFYMSKASNLEYKRIYSKR